MGDDTTPTDPEQNLRKRVLTSLKKVRTGYQNYKQSGVHQRIVSPTLGMAGAGMSAAGARAQAMAGGAWGLAAGAGGAIGNRIGNAAAVAAPAAIWFLGALLVYIMDWIYAFNGIEATSLVRFMSWSGLQELRNSLFNIFVIAGIIIYTFFVFLNRRSKGQGFASGKAIVAFVFIAVAGQIVVMNFPQYNAVNLSLTEILLLALMIVGGAETFSFCLVLLMISFTLTFGGVLNGDIASMFHLGFAVLLWMGLLRKKYQDPSEADAVMAFYLFLDFFAFSIAGVVFNDQIIANRLFLPIPILFTIWATWELEKNWFTQLVTYGTIILYLLYAVALSVNYGDLTAKLDENKKVQAMDAFKQVIAKFKQIINITRSGITSEYNKTVNLARGDYYDTYQAEVNQKAKEKLGVSLEDLKPFSSSYYDNEPALIGGRLVAKSLNEEIKVSRLSCYTKIKNAEQQDIVISGKIDPDVKASEPLMLSSSDQEFVTCEIPDEQSQGQWKAGSPKISFEVEFDFSTQSYLVSYYIEKERYQSYFKEGIDPFEQLGIKNKNPIAIYTSGPLKIGIGLRGPMIALDTAKENELPLVINIHNEWKGSVVKVNQFFLILPKDMQLKHDKEGQTSCLGYAFEPSSCSALQTAFTHADRWCSDTAFTIYSLNLKTPGKTLADLEHGKTISQEQTIACRVVLDGQQFLNHIDSQPYVEEQTQILLTYTYQLREEVPVIVKKSIAPTPLENNAATT